MQKCHELIHSNIDSEVLGIFRSFLNNREHDGCAENLCELLIRNNHTGFDNNSQMDPDEFIRCLLPLCEPLSNICEIHVKESLTCAAQVEATDTCPSHTCSDVTQQTVPHIGLQLFIKANTIAKII